MKGEEEEEGRRRIGNKREKEREKGERWEGRHTVGGGCAMLHTSSPGQPGVLIHGSWY